MNWDAIGAVGEAVGAAGVIISLLYLAVQIRGDARAKRATMTHAQSQANAGFASILATGPEVAELYSRGVQDFAVLRGAELIRFSALMIHMFRLYEDQFFQWTEGDFDPHVWHGLDAAISDFCSLPGLQAWWKTRSHWFSEQFQALIEGKIAEGRTPAMYGEATA